jgi:hypothetical protein
MAYQGAHPTLAEIFMAAGYHTEVITRNSLFDGTVPGATRGFHTNTRLLGDFETTSKPLTFVLALAKPRVRRLIRRSGFFHALQKNSRTFLTELARMGIPADQKVLSHALDQMDRLQRRGRPYFLFLNLYDVHAPYSPSPASPLRSFRSLPGIIENLMLPSVLPRVCGHAYLRPGFRLSNRARRMLLGRYHRAIELMDEKLRAFYTAAHAAGLLQDTILVLTSDHGEAFGEHGLYFHDASVYDIHLHVPLWIHHPKCAPRTVDDVVSTRDVFKLLRQECAGLGVAGTLLDTGIPSANSAALAEHFHYPHTAGLLPQYKQNIAAAIIGTRKAIARRGGLDCYDLARDPDELSPMACTIDDLEIVCRRDGYSSASIAAAIAHLRNWQASQTRSDR